MFWEVGPGRGLERADDRDGEPEQKWLSQLQAEPISCWTCSGLGGRLGVRAAAQTRGVLQTRMLSKSLEPEWSMPRALDSWGSASAPESSDP